MSSVTVISIEEYTHTAYRPDRDYVDGEARERNLGEYEHSKLQTAIAAWFFMHQREWNIDPVVEQRVQVRANRFRVPDISVLRRDQPRSAVVRIPPLICVEILSREDSLRDMRERVMDYLEFGVENVWVLDPARREAFVANQKGFLLETGDALAVQGMSIYLPLRHMFAELD